MQRSEVVPGRCADRIWQGGLLGGLDVEARSQLAQDQPVSFSLAVLPTREDAWDRNAIVLGFSARIRRGGVEVDAGSDELGPDSDRAAWPSHGSFAVHLRLWLDAQREYRLPTRGIEKQGAKRATMNAGNSTFASTMTSCSQGGRGRRTPHYT